MELLGSTYISAHLIVYTIHVSVIPFYFYSISIHCVSIFKQNSTHVQSRELLLQALFLCAPFLSKIENVHLFSSSLSRLDKCHETSRIFPRTECRLLSVMPGVLVSFLELHFLGKNGPFGFERPPSDSQKAISKSKGTFLRENECAK